MNPNPQKEVGKECAFCGHFQYLHDNGVGMCHKQLNNYHDCECRSFEYSFSRKEEEKREDPKEEKREERICNSGFHNQDIANDGFCHFCAGRKPQGINAPSEPKEAQERYNKSQQKNKDKICVNCGHPGDYHFSDTLKCGYSSQIHKQESCGCPGFKSAPQGKETPEKANFLQVGRAIECGHCQPEKYGEGLKQAEKAIPNYKCNCICHDKGKEAPSEGIGPEPCPAGLKCRQELCPYNAWHKAKHHAPVDPTPSPNTEWEKEFEDKWLGDWYDDWRGEFENIKSFIHQLLESERAKERERAFKAGTDWVEIAYHQGYLQGKSEGGKETKDTNQ